MEIMPLNVVLFGLIPEGMLIVWAGLQLMGIRPELKKLILVGILQGICGYFIRRYADFGTHIFFQTAMLIIFTHFIMGVKWMTAGFAMISSIVIVILVEGSIYIFTDMNLGYILSTDWIRILFLLPHEMILGVIGYICLKEDYSLAKEFGFLNKIIR